MHRRRLLRAFAAGTTAFAGCFAGGNRGGRTRTTETATPSPTATGTSRATPVLCESLDLPRPTPTADGLVPMPYPDYPATLTRDAAADFAARFERAYQYNDFLANDFIPGTDEVDVSGGVDILRENPDRFVAGVEGALRTADVHDRETQTGSETPTEAPHLDSPFAAWYELRETVAYRKGVRELGHDPLGFEDATKIYCLP